MDQRYTRFRNNTILVIIGNIGSKLMSFIMLPFYTRWLPIEGYGTVDIINIYVSFLIGVATCAIAESVFIFPKGQRVEKQKEYLNSGLLFMIMSFVVTLCIFMLIKFICDGKNIHNSFLDNIWLIYSILTTSALQQLVQQFTRSIDKIKVYSIAGVVLTGLTIGFSFIFIPKWGVGGYVAAMSLANVATVLYSLIASNSYTYFEFRYANIMSCRKMLSYSLPLVPNNIMWWLVSALNRPVMEIYLGMEAIGLFAVANKFPSVFSSVFAMFAVSWQISVMEEYGKDGYSQFFNKVFRIVILLMILASCFISILSPLIISVFANENYYESWKYVPVLSFSSVFMAISGMAGSNFSATKESKYFFYSSVWGALAAVIANIIFIPKIGTMGACFSVVLSFGVMSLSRCFYCWRYVKINNILRLMLSLVGNVMIIMLTLSSLYTSFKIVGYCLSFIFILYVNGDVLKQVFSVIKNKI